MTPPLIELDNVTVVRGGQTALDRLSLSIPSGAHVAVLGPNGSGKSTFVKLITRECYPRFLPPESRVRIFGHEVWNVEQLRALIGIVTNDLADRCVAPWPALEIVLSGYFGSIGIWPYHHVTPEMETHARALLARVGIAHLADRPMNEMSSGEQRRAVIARALVHGPRSLLLDEPTNSLDLKAAHELRTLLRQLAAEGVGILLVTHHLPDLIPEIDRVVCLKHGRLWRDGAKAEILRAETLSALFDTEVQLIESNGVYHLC
ncbi:MAG: ATP-binding cassette domain-containing protein [Bryobacter sp.]|nr:ATP-binding cassette domain-containing protein [Bryobacter sp.]